MAAAGRVGVDNCGGGVLLPGTQSFVLIDGAPWATIGTPVNVHGGGPHTAATMAEGAPWLTINGLPACYATHLASCGHPLAVGAPFFVAVVP